ncbi:hypothetical protein SZN_33461 [Streptomyces zinciresistens K42]|uniref:Uncharacterized protein n=1 Tax=Streptomyces zinciresistens K42 TaxID=700597 RepID=G2GME0_9ACTN|nr:hypothetical protein [Streptomyces zinciresistens]EGX55326.1 hypothetical protein SZN_33461 [Streptomyces zinciresistens K42]
MTRGLPATAGWDVADTRALGAGSSVAIPPARCTTGPGPRWRVCPGEDSWLTDPDALGRRSGAELST